MGNGVYAMKSLILLMSFFSFNLLGAQEEQSATLNEDQQKCFDIAKRVCDTSEDLKACVANHPNQFPSSCQQDVVDPVTSIKSVAGSQKMLPCTTALQKKCTLKLPEAQAKPDASAIKLAMKAYQVCMDEQVEVLDACKSLVDKEADPKATNKDALFQRISK